MRNGGGRVRWLVSKEILAVVETCDHSRFEIIDTLAKLLHVHNCQLTPYMLINGCISLHDLLSCFLLIDGSMQ